MTGEQALVARRQRLLGSATTFYAEPVHLVRGKGVWLWDRAGRRYLDCYNNVPHVGHAHPRVNAAIRTQLERLNTHNRYLHETLLDYAGRLTASLNRDGASLDTVLLTCTGSEANDVALQIARAVTGHRGFIATDAGYHGNTTAVAQLNGSKRPVGGWADHVRLVPAPDPQRRPDATGAGFAAAVADAAESLHAAGHGLAALILCPFFANEGFPDLPAGFLDPAAAALRQAGGLIIADEVQPGFGRLGPCFWGHRRIGLRPDIVTLGKPMGNGFPVAGLVTGADLMATWRAAFAYFNTFGGTPVAAAAALAVLDVLRDEDLPARAARVGAYGRDRLAERFGHHPHVGAIRGQGLFFGLEMVSNGVPDPALADRVVEDMRRAGVLLHKTAGHIVKIRPPMVFRQTHVDMLVAALETVLPDSGGKGCAGKKP